MVQIIRVVLLDVCEIDRSRVLTDKLHSAIHNLKSAHLQLSIIGIQAHCLRTLYAPVPGMLLAHYIFLVSDRYN